MADNEQNSSNKPKMDPHIKPGGSTSKITTSSASVQGYIPETMPASVIIAESLTAQLDEINGQDTYDSTVAALTTLPKKQYLVLPESLILPQFDAKMVGSVDAKDRFSRNDFYHIAALNYDVVSDVDNSVRCTFAILRAFAVTNGWIVSEGEVRTSALKMSDLVGPLNSICSFMADNPDLVSLIDNAAYILPFCSRHVFHTTGHHYLDHLKAEYEAKYAAILSATMKPMIANILPRNLLYHTALHWIKPSLVARVLDTAEDSPIVASRIPNAIWIRRKASPAGSALISTSAAVLMSMDAPGFTRVLRTVYPDEIDKVKTMATEISESPNKYHLTSRAYGLAPLSVEETRKMELAKAAARTLAPVCQAYINAYASQGSLARAAALKKVAFESPYFLRVIETWFRAFARKQREVTSLVDLLKGDVTVDDSTLVES